MTLLAMANFAISIPYIVLCETLQSTTDIIVKLISTAMGSNATYQCRDGSSDVHTTQCTSDGVWEPNPNSTLDCIPPGKMLAVFYLYNCDIQLLSSYHVYSYYLFIISVLCESLQTIKINPNSTLDCNMTDHGVPMQTRAIMAVIILVIVAGITIVVVAMFYWRIRNETSELYAA